MTMVFPSLNSKLSLDKLVIRSSTSLNTAEGELQHPDDLTEGFGRLQRLVDKLLNVNEPKIEENSDFVKSMINQLSSSLPYLSNEQNTDLGDTNKENTNADEINCEKGEQWVEKSKLKSFSDVEEIISEDVSVIDNWKISVKGNDDSLISFDFPTPDDSCNTPLSRNLSVQSKANIISSSNPVTKSTSTFSNQLQSFPALPSDRRVTTHSSMFTTSPETCSNMITISLATCSSTVTTSLSICTSMVSTSTAVCSSTDTSPATSSNLFTSFPKTCYNPDSSSYTIFSRTVTAPVPYPDTLNNLLVTSPVSLPSTITFPSSTVSSLTSSASVPSTSSATISVVENCGKSKYEMIRDDIIAERNAQLRAMGFFKEFSVLKFEMMPEKPEQAKSKTSNTLVKKRSIDTREKCGQNWVRRSERIFLSSPEVERPSYQNNQIASFVVENIIKDVVAAVQTRVSSLFVCEDCGKGFKKKRYMTKHSKSYHKKLLNIQCSDYKTFKQKKVASQIELHRRPHDSFETSLKNCDLCDYVTKHRWDMTRHKAKVHKQDEAVMKVEHNLELINRDFVDEIAIESDVPHQVSYKEPESYSDSDCVLIFTDDSDDDIVPVPPVKKMQTGDKNCQEPEIQVVTRNQGVSDVHKAKLCNVTKHCSVCNFTTRSKSHLKLHERKQLESVKCDFSTHSAAQLSLHRREREKLFVQLKCSECSFRSSSKYFLHQHQVMVHKM